MLGRGTSIAAEKFYQIPTSNVPKACEKMNVNVVVEPKFSDTGFWKGGFTSVVRGVFTYGTDLFSLNYFCFIGC